MIRLLLRLFPYVRRLERENADLRQALNESEEQRRDLEEHNRELFRDNIELALQYWTRIEQPDTVVVVPDGACRSKGGRA